MCLYPTIYNRRIFIKRFPSVFQRGHFAARDGAFLSTRCDHSVAIDSIYATPADMGEFYVFGIQNLGHYDLNMVKYICERVAVMYLGTIVEMARSDELYDNPCHPYTKALLSAIPVVDPIKERTRKRVVLEGDVPSPVDPPSGCRFAGRCPEARVHCRERAPEWKQVASGHYAACWRNF